MEYLLFDDFSTTNDTQLATSITSTPEDASYHMHNFYEIFYILEGDITHISENVTEKLTVGDIVLLRKTDKHMFKREKNTFCSHRDIIVSEELFIKACNFLNPNLINFIISSPTYIHSKISKEKIIEFENTISEIYLVPDNDTTYLKTTMINSFAISLLTLFINNVSPSEKKAPPWLKELLPRFEIPVIMKQGLFEVTKNVNYNYSYVCRIFKEYMNCSMTQYLLEKRLNYAAYLLQLSNNTIATICETIGIDSIPYFTIQFKKKFGSSPKDFRKKSKVVI